MLIHNNPPIPNEVTGREGFADGLYDLAVGLIQTDVPSPSDVTSIIPVYNQANPETRDMMDRVFVWFTGYSLASLAAMVEAQRRKPPPSDFADIVQEWRDRADATS